MTEAVSSPSRRSRLSTVTRVHVSTGLPFEVAVRRSEEQLGKWDLEAVRAKIAAAASRPDIEKLIDAMRSPHGLATTDQG